MKLLVNVMSLLCTIQLIGAEFAYEDTMLQSSLNSHLEDDYQNYFRDNYKAEHFALDDNQEAKNIFQAEVDAQIDSDLHIDFVMPTDEQEIVQTVLDDEEVVLSSRKRNHADVQCAEDDETASDAKRIKMSKQEEPMIGYAKSISPLPVFYLDGSEPSLNDHSVVSELYTCHECYREFAQKSILTRHMRTHTGEKSYQCDYPECHYAAAQSCNLIRHKRKHIGVKPFTCNQCDYAASTSANLNVHKRRHSGEKPYECNQCQFASAQSGNLTSHMIMHTGEKPYTCGHEGCGMAFAKPSALTKHKITHTGDKAFICDQCAKAFARKHYLIEHKRIHTGEKPFACGHEGCGKAFAQCGALTKHMRTHTGERPYTCKQCVKAFARKSSLIDHERIHHGEKPFCM